MSRKSSVPPENVKLLTEAAAMIVLISIPFTVPSGLNSRSPNMSFMLSMAWCDVELPCIAFAFISVPNCALKLKEINMVLMKRQIIN